MALSTFILSMFSTRLPIRSMVLLLFCRAFNAGRSVEVVIPLPLRFHFIGRRLAIIAMLVLCISTMAGCRFINRKESRELLSSQRIVAQSDQAAARGDIQHAEELLGKAVDQSPDDSEIHWRLAKILKQKKDYPSAISACQQCLKLLPNDLRAYRELAKLYIEEGEYQLAESHADRAFVINPYDFETLHLKAKLAAYRQEFDDAISYYHQALGQNSESKECTLELAELHYNLKQADQAAPLLRGLLTDSAMLSDETVAQIQWQLGNNYGQMKRWSDAATVYQKAIILNQFSDPDQLVQLAEMQLRLEQNAQAIHSLQQALQAAPENEFARTLLTQIQPLDADSTQLKVKTVSNKKRFEQDNLSIQK